MRNWAKKWVNGTLPSELIVEEYDRNPSATAGQVAEIFLKEFPGIDWRAAVFIRRWNREQKTGLGLGTEELDQYVGELCLEWQANEAKKK